MRILVVADIHGNNEKLKTLLDKINKNIDLVICPGDFTDMFNTPADFSQMDVANMVLQKLLALKKPLFCVPGNHDPYEILKLFDEYNVNLHAKTKKFQDTVFIGFGGAQTPFNTIFEPSEEEIKESLEKQQIKNNFVLVVHNPPKDTKVDKILSGQHVGSQAIREFILERKPLLSISAHIHEAVGEDKLGKTTLFYPGPVFEGRYGIVEIEGNNVRCESKKIEI